MKNFKRTSKKLIKYFKSQPSTKVFDLIKFEHQIDNNQNLSDAWSHIYDCLPVIVADDFYDNFKSPIDERIVIAIDAQCQNYQSTGICFNSNIANQGYVSPLTYQSLINLIDMHNHQTNEILKIIKQQPSNQVFNPYKLNKSLQNKTDLMKIWKNIKWYFELKTGSSLLQTNFDDTIKTAIKTQVNAYASKNKIVMFQANLIETGYVLPINTSDLIQLIHQDYLINI